MISESDVVSFEWAGKMKQFGWKQDVTVFYWDDHTELGEGRILTENPEMANPVAAPMAGSIFRSMPPMKVETDDNLITFVIPNTEKDRGSYTESSTHEEKQDTLANSSAAMWCYLVENKFL